MDNNHYKDISEVELYDEFNKMVENMMNEPEDTQETGGCIRALTQKELIHVFFNRIVGLPQVSLSFIQYMVDNGIDPRSGLHENKDDGFIKICEYGSLEKINYFIDNFGSDINAQKGKPLQRIIENNHYDIFKLFVEKACQVKNEHLFTLFHGAKIQYIEIIMQNNYNDVDVAKSFIVFLYKKQSNLFKLLKFFVDSGVDLNNIVAKL